MLHELIHALEDQYIDLEQAIEAVEKDGDRVFAMKCVIEGSAEHARIAIYEKVHPDIAKLSHEEQAKSSGADMAKIVATTPAFLLLPDAAPLPDRAGLRRAPSATTTRAAWRSCTRTRPRPRSRSSTRASSSARTATCRARSRGRPTSRPRSATGWKGLEVTPVGELDFVLWLDRWFGAADGKLDMDRWPRGPLWTKEAQTAAEGWDGMKTQILEKNGKPTTIAMISAWDSQKDADEAADALATALAKQYGKDFVLTGFGGGDGATRSLDFSDPYGEGRLLVRDDVVRLLDGVPADALARVWAKLAAAKIARDPADTWTPETDVDPLATAAWKDLKSASAGTSPPTTGRSRTGRRGRDRRARATSLRIDRARAACRRRC